MKSHTLFTSIYSVCSPTFPFYPSSFQQWLKSWMYWHVSSHHPTTCEQDRGEFRWESVCWGVKDPLSPKPSPVHPTESPDGVIQPSWSPANSYSHKHTQLHTHKALGEKVTDILFPLLSHHSEAALEERHKEEVWRGSSADLNPQGKVTFAWLKARISDRSTEEDTGKRKDSGLFKTWALFSHLLGFKFLIGTKMFGVSSLQSNNQQCWSNCKIILRGYCPTSQCLYLILYRKCL